MNPTLTIFSILFVLALGLGIIFYRRRKPAEARFTQTQVETLVLRHNAPGNTLWLVTRQTHDPHTIYLYAPIFNHVRLSHTDALEVTEHETSAVAGVVKERVESDASVHRLLVINPAKGPASEYRFRNSAGHPVTNLNHVRAWIDSMVKATGGKA